VFFDFDGRFRRDIGVHLLERLATGDWLPWTTCTPAGTIGSRECMVSSGPAFLMRRRSDASRGSRRDPRSTRVRPLVDALRERRRGRSVSDGFGYYVHDRNRFVRRAVFTTEVDFANEHDGFPNANPDCVECAQCGTLKKRYDRRSCGAPPHDVFVGDGTSVVRGAAADVVFATRLWPGGAPTRASLSDRSSSCRMSQRCWCRRSSVRGVEIRAVVY